MKWRNWARTVTTTPRAWLAPASEAEVADIVRGGGRIRVVGAGHSWSAIAAPDDVGVSLDRLTGVDITGDVAVVRGGTRLDVLDAALAERGLALPIVGSIMRQSIAGAIATGTHGSSLQHGNLASLVTAMRVVDGRGEIDRGVRDPGAFVHLGALGVVTEVTLRVVPAFSLAGEVERVPIAALDVEPIARSAEYVKVWWLPHLRDAYVYRYTRTTEPVQRSLRAQRWIDDHVMHAVLFPIVSFVERVVPASAPVFNRVVGPTLAHGRRIGPSALVLTTPYPVRHRETEAAMPLARASEALARIVRAVDRDKLRVGFPLEVRFVRGDDGWLSPAQGGDTCQIGAYAGEPADAYFAAFWREMRGARPHWGKEIDHAAGELRPLYPRWAEFAALRDRLDPERRFDNAFTRRVLG